VSKSPTTIAVDQPVVFAAAPAIGYLIAYLDRLGEAVAYGIPLDYISVSVTDALSRVSIVFVAIVAMFALVRVEKALATRLEPWTHRPLSTASTWLFIASVALVLAWNLWLLGFAVITGLFWTAIELVYGFARRKSIAAERPSVKRASNGPAILGEPVAKRDFLQVPAVLLAASLVMALLFAFAGGNLRAASRTRYMVSQQDSQQVILALYADKAVLGRLEENGVLGDERWLVTPGGSVDGYVWSNVGPIYWEQSFSFLPHLNIFSNSD
jgi:hypothetical protein